MIANYKNLKDIIFVIFIIVAIPSKDYRNLSKSKIDQVKALYTHWLLVLRFSKLMILKY